MRGDPFEGEVGNLYSADLSEKEIEAISGVAQKLKISQLNTRYEWVYLK